VLELITELYVFVKLDSISLCTQKDKDEKKKQETQLCKISRHILPNLSILG